MDEILGQLREALGDRYAVERQIGQGGMATVFLAEDLKHRRRVAIKVLRPELSIALGAERFLREIEVAARLQHPHIVPVYDSGQAGRLLYYVMPFVEGESLRDLLQREKRLPITRAAAIVREAASGLAYAHQQGIVHRDVKPENIMLSGGHAVVTDFGIARAIESSRTADAQITGAGMVMGTPAYMSPEQATADVVDARSDQYALACVFYEMVTGRQAFSGKTMQALMTSVLTGPRPKLTAVVADAPAGIDAATQRALSADPSQRFQTIQQFADAVADESSGAAAATRESRRWKRLAIILPLIVLGIAGLWYVTSGRAARVVVSGAETIAVVPFSTSGSGVEGLGEGMVDLLAANLDGVGGIRAIEPRTVLREWRRRTDGRPGSLDDALAVARAAKAASVLTGSIVATGSTARLTAELFDLQGQPLARAQVDGPADSLLILADGLALGVLREIWRSREPLPSANASGIASTSMPAIRSYLDGERFHRRGQWDSAQVAFERAVALDSTFALAWYRLANTLGWQGVYAGGAAQQAATNATRFSAALPPRIRALLSAYQLFQAGESAAADSARAYVQRFPDDADGWYLLGEAQYHARAASPLPPADLIAPFDRVIALDSTLTPAAIHPVELALFLRDTTLLRRYASVLRASGATNELTQVDLARRAIAGEDSALVQMFSGGAPGTSGIAFATLVGAMHQPEVTGDDIARLAGVLGAAGRATNSPMGMQLRALHGVILGSLARRDAARAIADELRPVNQDLASFVGLAPIYGGFGARDGMARTLSSLESAPKSPYTAYLRALIAYDLGEAARARAAVRDGFATGADTLGRWMLGALTTVDGLAMIAAGDSVRGRVRADSGVRLIGGQLQGTFTGPPLLRYAQMLAAQPATRAQGIARLRYGFDQNPELLPITQYSLGKAWEAAGQRDSAVVAYGQFIRLWNAPDTLYRARVEDAKAALARLTAEQR